MKLGVISDVHGDPYALKLALARLTMLGAERVLCAGDVVGYGPEPDEVVAILREQQIAVVRGNHDRWALERLPGEPDTFGGAATGPETREFLQDLPPYLVLHETGRVGVVAHGLPGDDMHYVTRRTCPPPVLRRLLEMLRADLLIVGHTHQPMWYRSDQGLVVNPGSVVSLPVVRSSRSFALIDLAELSVTFHEVETGREIPLAPWAEEA